MAHERCTTADRIEIHSSSKAQKVYTVSFKEPIATCNCVAYAIGRNRSVSVRNDINKNHPAQLPYCKHIEKAEKMGVCRWRGETPLFPGMCPLCGGPTEVCDDIVTFL